MANRDKHTKTRFTPAILILAIAAVAIFQAAFIVYTVSDTPTEITTSVIDPIDTAADLFDIESDELSPVSDQASGLNSSGSTDTIPSIAGAPGLPKSKKAKTLPVKTRTPIRARSNIAADKQFQKSRRAESRQLPERHIAYMPPGAKARRGFGDTIITYHIYETPEAATTAKITKTRKRSLIARAMPILKKPWDLIKAIGSRLN